ncbi:mobile mystery protein A [bacterium]|nr:mobile mystery protein A [bacterium]
MSSSLKTVERDEARARVLRAQQSTGAQIRVPKIGWIRTLRTALGMSGDALARRMSLSRAASVRLEASEISNSITLKSLQAAADAMNCRLVYALVPKTAESVDDLIDQQAERKARSALAEVAPHMALEAQSLTRSAEAAELKRLKDDLVHRIPRDFWDD